MMQDKIEKTIELAAARAKVWQALTDHEQFGEWFRVKLEGPFVVGEPSRGMMTYPGYETMPWDAIVEAIEPEHFFSFSWRDVDPKDGKLGDPMTLVEFRLEEIPSGTRLTVTESGFSALPSPRRLEVFRENTEGWNEQMRNIAAYVEA